MRIPRVLMVATASAALLLTGTPAGAAMSYINGEVTRVLVNGDDSYGGCMAALSVDPKTLLPACGSWWITFSCSGDFTDPARAYRLVDQAQLALAANKQVLVAFQDDKQHNGYCFANRIDVIR